MGVTLSGIMYLPVTGYTVDNRSLAGRANPIFPLRLLSMKSILRQSTRFTFYGDQLTRTIVEFLSVEWGDNGTLRYETLQPGWKYEWDINAKTFIVTDNQDPAQVTQYANIEAVLQLGISWEIFTSHQFIIYYDPNGGPQYDTFLPGLRIPPELTAEVGSMDFMNMDYIVGVQHAVFDFLSDGFQEQNPGESSMSAEFAAVDHYPSILLANTDELNFINYYPLNLLPGDTSFYGERPRLQHIGYKQTITTLMIYTFASQLLSSLDSKIVYEPWMLWELFKWVFVRPGANSRDKIFDLSPWWG